CHGVLPGCRVAARSHCLHGRAVRLPGSPGAPRRRATARPRMPPRQLVDGRVPPGWVCGARRRELHRLLALQDGARSVGECRVWVLHGEWHESTAPEGQEDERGGCVRRVPVGHDALEGPYGAHDADRGAFPHGSIRTGGQRNTARGARRAAVEAVTAARAQQRGDCRACEGERRSTDLEHDPHLDGKPRRADLPAKIRPVRPSARRWLLTQPQGRGDSQVRTQ
ncbi:hypothetical protein T484DRAFT_3641393, partial [Baffinella frigidus]